MEQFKLTESEYRFVTVVWESEPIQSGELAALCFQRLGWKKSTVYTVLKSLCQKGVLKSENAIVSAAVPMEQVRRDQCRQFVERTFGGSLPMFVAAFAGGKRLPQKELDELRELLSGYGEDV